MGTALRSITIDRPRLVVWDRLAEFGAIADWADNVDHSCVMQRSGEGPPAGIGAVRRVQVGRRTLLERVVVWESPKELAYEIEGLPPVVTRAQNRWTLTGRGSGSTVVTLTTTIDCGPRPPQKLVARLLAERLAKDSETMLAGLAASIQEPAHV